MCRPVSRRWPPSARRDRCAFCVGLRLAEKPPGGAVEQICEQGVTVLIVAHDVNPIIGFLDLVVYLASGSAACCQPRDVITSERLTELYGTPIEVLETSTGQLVVVGHSEVATYHPEMLHHGHAH